VEKMAGVSKKLTRAQLNDRNIARIAQEAVDRETEFKIWIDRYGKRISNSCIREAHRKLSVKAAYDHGTVEFRISIGTGSTTESKVNYIRTGLSDNLSDEYVVEVKDIPMSDYLEDGMFASIKVTW